MLALLDGEVWLVCSLLYGAGLRLFEAMQLRVKDIDFSRSELLLRDGKGQKDRVTMLPTKVQPRSGSIWRWCVGSTTGIWRVAWGACRCPGH